MMVLSAENLMSECSIVHQKHRNQPKIDRTGTTGKAPVNNSTGDATSAPIGLDNPDRPAESGRLAYFKHDYGHVNFAFVDWDGFTSSRIIETLFNDHSPSSN
ncbi:unnamed protein product [Phyllotreta striolata]|uniref:Uncharacterized protein n=1 Tax=Phyllotreta striolata TaxID=444603 RepID=A0A9N9TY99_PHYSR|nr:unnamed protein product [Phyllotreta striolata]